MRIFEKGISNLSNTKMPAEYAENQARRKYFRLFLKRLCKSEYCFYICTPKISVGATIKV